MPNSALRLRPKITKRYVKATGTKPVSLTYTVQVKGKTKGLLLRNMGVQITAPVGAVVTKAWSHTLPGGVQGTVQGNAITFSPLTFQGTKTRAFRVKLVLTPPFNASTDLSFQAEVFQNADGLAVAPYCPLSARDVRLSIRYP